MPGINTVIDVINRLAGSCRGRDVPVIWIRHSISSKGPRNLGLYPLFHDKAHTESVMDRGKETEIFSGMNFDPVRDHIVFKDRYSAFLSDPPELQEKLDSLQRSQLIIAGVAANVCVESTVRDAMQMDYEVVLVSDGVTAPDQTFVDSTLRNTRLFFGDVRSAEEIASALARQT
jgi:nicotinamidase-related amidase